LGTFKCAAREKTVIKPLLFGVMPVLVGLRAVAGAQQYAVMESDRNKVVDKY
jgi:hypothetical protein